MQSVHLLRSNTQLPSGQTFSIFPAGCTVDEDHVSSVLEPCCTAAGSSPTQDPTDGTSGCPYNDVFLPTSNQTFGSCALDKGAASVSCAPTLVTKHNSGESSRHPPRMLHPFVFALLLLSSIGLGSIIPSLP
uniref:Uncharacterized protein n=1 Tax=Mycena chlorophos TaxID=658473 RepID=A0ABQ0LR52_MYCCL|nr:predicted protein [Mycena chlorophos]